MYRLRTPIYNVGNWVLPDTLDIDEIKNFEIRTDDIFVVTQPSCGTTWMQELTWLIKNDVRLELAQATNQFYRAPFLEVETLGGPICYVSRSTITSTF